MDNTTPSIARPNVAQSGLYKYNTNNDEKIKNLLMKEDEIISLCDKTLSNYNEGQFLVGDKLKIMRTLFSYHPDIEEKAGFDPDFNVIIVYVRRRNDKNIRPYKSFAVSPCDDMDNYDTISYMKALKGFKRRLRLENG